MLQHFQQLCLAELKLTFDRHGRQHGEISGGQPAHLITGTATADLNTMVFPCLQTHIAVGQSSDYFRQQPRRHRGRPLFHHLCL